MTDRERFSRICLDTAGSEHRREGIGTYGEKSVHYALKLFFEEREECREVPVGKYIADIKNESGITEIQTSGFGAMKRKLEDYLCSYNVNLVFPVPENKHVIKIFPETGEVVKEYNSPRHMKPAEIFKELLYLGESLYSPGLSFTIVSLAVEELSYHSEVKTRKRKSTDKIDRLPKELLGIMHFDSAYDMGELFPYSDGENVTSAQIRNFLRAKGRSGWAAVRIMEGIGFIKRCGKEGNRIIYEFQKKPYKYVE